VTVAVGGDTEERSPFGLNLWVMPDGEAVVYLCGELDATSAEAAFSYVGDVIDRCGGPVVVDLSALQRCDGDGLRALARMRVYADWSNCPFRLASPRDTLVRLTQARYRNLTSPFSPLCGDNQARALNQRGGMA
jgi:anti-anti-sigma regulatory factor